MKAWRYMCERCGAVAPLETRAWRCHVCQGAFKLAGPTHLSASRINRDDPTLWRYADTLPVDRRHATSLGEGMTPLIRGRLADHEVWFKNDTLLPTGSFKDRGAVVLSAHLRRLGIERLTVDSSGNAAAAMAGYCAASGIACTVYAPQTTSAAKLVQARAFGADVVLVAGDREAVARAAQDAVESDAGAFYASHNWHAVFVEGVKTWALETWEQLGGEIPASVYVPTGGGSAFVGAYRGFQSLGTGMPRLIAAQPEACAPVVAAYHAQSDEIAAVVPGQTIAEGTRIGAPARGRQIMSALERSGGRAQPVSEDRVVQALRELWSQGLYVEPTAAVGAAAFLESAERDPQMTDGTNVILLTGSGLKATEAIGALLS
jgi:threonine synthase